MIFVLADLAAGRGWPWDSQVAWTIRSTERAVLRISVAGQHVEVILASLADRAPAIWMLQDVGKALSSRALPEFLSVLQDACALKVPAVPPPEYCSLTWDDLRGLSRSGVDIGIHGCSHRVMSALIDSEARDEISESWKEISRHVPTARLVLAWPTGRDCDFGPRDELFAQQVGLEAAFAVGLDHCEVSSQGAGRFHLKRFAFPTDSLSASR